jgi:hypothetical protein
VTYALAQPPTQVFLWHADKRLNTGGIMKNLGLAFLVMLSLAVVSCGKKEGGGGSDGFSTSEYSTQEGILNWTTGVIKVGGRSYNPQAQQVSPASFAVISQAYFSKPANVTYVTQNNQVSFRVQINAIETHYNGQKALDIRSLKFINYYR